MNKGAIKDVGNSFILFQKTEIFKIRLSFGFDDAGFSRLHCIRISSIVHFTHLIQSIYRRKSFQ